METKRTGLFENGLIWFGAGVSIAEILTGTYLAPLGMGKGLAAIIVGHIIGCLMLFLAGVIGGKVRKSAMETVKMSFGQKGSRRGGKYRTLDLVSGHRSTDHPLDRHWNYKSWKDQYGCHGSFVYPDIDPL